MLLDQCSHDHADNSHISSYVAESHQRHLKRRKKDNSDAADVEAVLE